MERCAVALTTGTVALLRSSVALIAIARSLTMTAALVIALIALLIVAGGAALSLRIVKQHDQGVLFRMRRRR